MTLSLPLVGRDKGWGSASTCTSFFENFSKPPRFDDEVRCGPRYPTRVSNHRQR
jgi:hypothetical protein